MARAIKQMKRSHRSYSNYRPFGDFERKAQVKKTRADNKSFLAKLFHRTTNKEDKE